jgi:hypothetical protein
MSSSGIWKPGSYLTENTLRLHYRAQPVNLCNIWGSHVVLYGEFSKPLNAVLRIAILSWEQLGVSVVVFHRSRRTVLTRKKLLSVCDCSQIGCSTVQRWGKYRTIAVKSVVSWPKREMSVWEFHGDSADRHTTFWIFIHCRFGHCCRRFGDICCLHLQFGFAFYMYHRNVTIYKLHTF